TGEAPSPGDAQDGAVVLGDPEGAVGKSLEVGQISVLVQDAGELGNLGGKPHVLQPRDRALDPPSATPLEDPFQDLGILVLDVGDPRVVRHAPNASRVCTGIAVAIIRATRRPVRVILSFPQLIDDWCSILPGMGMSFPKPDEASKAFFESLVPEDRRVQSRP